MTADEPADPAPVSREVVRELLARWQSGSVNERHVHEAAEEMYDHYGKEPPIYLDSDPRSIALEVVSELSVLNHQLITRADIPAAFAFLATPVGEEASGWRTWKGYWDGVDFEQRARDLADNDYYTTTRRPTDERPDQWTVIVPFAPEGEARQKFEAWLQKHGIVESVIPQKALRLDITRSADDLCHVRYQVRSDVLRSLLT